MNKIRLLPFGGPLLKKSNAKVARTLCVTSWIRVVLVARNCDFNKEQRIEVVRKILKATAGKFKIKIEGLSADGNQLQFSIQLRRKKSFAPFIRGLTGSLALAITKGSKNKPLRQAFWECRPWTCIIEKVRALFGPSTLRRFKLEFELAELFKSKSPEALLALGP